MRATTIRAPYRNQIPLHQAPKPLDGNHNSSRLGNGVLYESRNSKWKPYQALRVSASIPGSGEVDKRVCWRCADCGAPASGPEQACCARCGSVSEPEYR